jgi:membrane peptidoglycan carboxypeptidase
VKVGQLAPRPKHVLIGLAGAIVVSGVLLGVAYARTTIPSPSAIASQQTTTIYYSDGKHVLARIGDTNRQDVSLNQVPIGVQHAILAAEDRHFYSEPGVSPTGIVRALAVDLRGGDITQGGSTITQQYAKNAYLSSHRSLSRKLKEIFIATKLGQTRSKNTILEDYLNTIYFGRDAYGIQAASKAYFNRNVEDLTPAQGALLAAVIRGPALYDPIIKANRPRALARWHYVISGMVTQGWLTPAQAQHLKFPKTLKRYASVQSKCFRTTCYIRDDVEQELVHSDGFSQAQLDLGGYKVVTTIDYHAEKTLIAAEQNVVPYNPRGTPMSGAASIVPGDGAIEALYGGYKYCHKPNLNKAACIDLSGFTGQWARPPGSSFKAFTLLAALKQGIPLSSRYDGPPTIDIHGVTIHNSSPGESCYGCTLLTAFARSINTIFVPLAQQVGPGKVVQAAYDAGIPKSRNLPAVPDISLGPADVSPMDLANAYATIAANGTRATPYLVRSVRTTTGQQLYKARRHLVPGALPRDVTANEIYAMTKVLAPGGTAYGHALTGRPSAGKTGTTDNNTNAWFTGFTPQLCTSVWIGNVDPTQTVEGAGVGEVFGGTLPAEIWQQSMNAALATAPVVPFPSPSQGGTVSVTSTPTSTPSKTPTQKPTQTPTKTPTAPPPTNTPTETPSTTPPTSSPTVKATGTSSPAAIP